MREHREAWSAVEAAPDDDAPRAVLADALAGAGHPLGEFITLQLAASGRPARGVARQREKELLRTVATQWAPRGLTNLVFKRGFVAQATLVGHPDPTDPSWNLLEVLDASFSQVSLCANTPLRSLRAARHLLPAELGALLAVPRPRLTEFSTVGLAVEALLPRLARAPGLREFSTDEPVSSLAALERLLPLLPPGLSRLGVDGSRLSLRGVQPLLARLAPSLTLSFGYGDRCRIDLSASRVRRVFDTREADIEALIGQRLRELGLREVELERPPTLTSPLYYDAQVRVFPSLEGAQPIVGRVSTTPPPPPEPGPSEWE